METANPYFKVNKYEYLNQNRIEAVCAYLHSRPLVRYAQQMEENGMCKKMQLRHQIKSIIFYDNGEIFLCPYSPDTYMKRMDDTKFTVSVPKKIYIRTDHVLEVTTRLNAKQHQIYMDAKENHSYIRLSGKKKTGYYVFVESGRIYGISGFKSLPKE